MESLSRLSGRSSTILCGVELPAIILGRALPKKPVPTIPEPSSLLSEFQLPFVIMDVNELTQAMGNTHLSDRREGDGEVDQLLFQPRAENGISDTVLRNIPRYLFRIASPYSDGATDAKWAKSQSAVSRDGSSTEDIFRNLDDEKRAHVATVLNLHLRWWPKEGAQDNFVSWTSSLLFAIQYIYYRSASSQDESSRANIKLYIIDTTKFPTGTFMRDLDLIDIFCEHNTELERLQDMRATTDYYFGEYLSQGSLKIENKCQVIPADVLFQSNRLRRLQSQFGELCHNVEPKPLWAKEVIKLRRGIWSESDLPLLEPEDMENRLVSLKEIMNHVEDDWKFPIGIYFAALFGSELFAEEQENVTDTRAFKYFRSKFSFIYGVQKRPSSPGTWLLTHECHLISVART